ncbi:MAG: hypothetical protein ABI388_02940 [Bacteroidia bacterium]
MKKIIIPFLLFTLLSFSLAAQTKPVTQDKGSYKKNYTEGNLNEGDNEFKEALKYYLFAYKYDSTSANVNFKIGFCYLKMDVQKHLAERYLEKAVQNVTKHYIDDDAGFKKAPKEAYFYLGLAYHYDGKLDEASKMYDTYESYLKPKEKTERKLLEHYKQQILNAKRILGAPLNVTITNLGDSINTEFPEYSPVITADEQVLYYTTRRPTTTGGEKSEDDGKYFEDIVVSYKDINGKWSKPSPISPFINTASNEATISLTPDGQTLIIYKGDVGNGDIFYSSFDGKDWTIPSKFGSNINTEYWETHACLSRDNQTLYFVSDRPGGMGGRDIYRCVKLPNGQWSLATNVGAPINTPYDEDGPFLGADGVTFYFASSGDKSMGGFDIMFSTIDEMGKFSEPTSMGSPINTTDNDVFYVATPDNKRFYFSSAHEYTKGGDQHGKSFGDQDIYMGHVDLIKENPLALFRGRFTPGPCDSLPDDLSVIVTSTTSGEIIGTYRPQRRTGTFSVIIPPGSKYNFSYQQGGQELSSEQVFVPADISYEEIQKAINLKPLKICPGVISRDTNANQIALNVVVLNNKRDKKPVTGADIKLLSKGVVDVVAKSDEDGHKNGIPLQVEKSYEIMTSADGKTAKPIIFNTIGVKGGKTYDKVIYLEKSADDDINLDLVITALNNAKKRQPIAGASVKVTGTDGTTFNGTTDDKGVVNGIALNPNTNYQVEVGKDGLVEKVVVSTQGMRKTKTIQRVVYLEGVSEVPDNSTITGDCFSFFFKYNMNEVDETAPEYKQFMDKIMAVKTAGGKIILHVNGSASTVPTRKFKNNGELAQTRANQTIIKIRNSLKQMGITDADITIASNKASVGGSAYAGDKIVHAATYEKFQFVKVCLAK